MEFRPLQVVSCDVLVIGGGGAGLRAAIEARELGAEVVVVSKSRAGYGNNTMISKATLASASGWADSRDDPEVFVRDTIVGGRFINDRKLVTTVAHGSGEEIAFLEKCGVRFLKHLGNIRAIHAPGHTYPRHIRVEQQTGRGLTLPLRKYATQKGIRFADRVFITRLLASREERMAAATGFDQEGGFFAFLGSCFVLASGGFGQAYLHTNNAPGITGDGQALAYELGIPLRDMEFVQFYPTASGNAWTRIILYEDLILGDKAVLRNADGDDILVRHGLDNPMAMTRDRLTQVIMEEILKGKGVSGGVMMDLREVSEGHVLQYQSLFRDPAKKEFIVAPTTHFCNGGIMINEEAETQMPGLFAAGEVCGGIHGANRIAGNALSEVFVIGGIAGRKASLQAREIGRPELPEREIAAEKVRLESLSSGGNRPLRELQHTIKELMWYRAGITRDEKGLERALGQIEGFHSYIREMRVKGFGELMKVLELQNMMILAEMVCRAALLRTESRGAHYRNDYPEEDDDNWLKNIVISKQESGMSLQAVPVSMDRKRGKKGGEGKDRCE